MKIKHKIKEKPGKLTKEKEVGQRKQENFCPAGISLKVLKARQIC